MTRFLVRVDDVGQSSDQSQPDEYLRLFARWLRAWGPVTEPLYLGVVPAFCGPVERCLLDSLEVFSEARVALHGWDHARGPLTATDIVMAHQVFPQANVFIPPYNEYDTRTLMTLEGRVLLGGFHGEHHHYGEAPCVVSGALHISARRDLYARCYQLVDVIDTIEDPGYPVQIVLHWRWDLSTMGGVRKLRDKLEGKMVSVAEAYP